MYIENITANKLRGDIWLCGFLPAVWQWVPIQLAFPKARERSLAKMSQCILFSIFSMCSKGRLTLTPALMHHFENSNSKAQGKAGRKGTACCSFSLSGFHFAGVQALGGEEVGGLEDGCDTISQHEDTLRNHKKTLDLFHTTMWCSEKWLLRLHLEIKGL